LRRDLINERSEAPGANLPSSSSDERYSAGPYDLLWNRIDKMNFDANGNAKVQTDNIQQTVTRT
jgi:hypothetical protein